MASEIVDAALWLHRRAGPGMMESVYQRLFAQELERRALTVLQKPRLRFELEGLVFERGLIPDLVVDGAVIVELKAVQEMKPVFWRQVLTYLRALDLPLGLLINFGGATLKEGLHRVVNNHYPPSGTAIEEQNPLIIAREDAKNDTRREDRHQRPRDESPGNSRT